MVVEMMGLEWWRSGRGPHTRYGLKLAIDTGWGSLRRCPIFIEVARERIGGRGVSFGWRADVNVRDGHVASILVRERGRAGLEAIMRQALEKLRIAANHLHSHNRTAGQTAGSAESSGAVRDSETTQPSENT